MSSQFHVGATVRVPRSELPKTKGRATVATLQEDDNTACVLWEPLAPKSLSVLPASDDADSKKNSKRRLKRSFLIAPLILQDHKREEETEATVAISDLRAVLDFEQDDAPKILLEDPNQISSWKERGDQLLRLGDPSAACSCYELALRLSSILQTGSSVIVKERGHAKVADVDCLDDDDEDCIEISMVDSGEEKVVKEREILLCVLYKDDEDRIQERILLNLARCLLQLAEVAKHQEMVSERRPRYLRGSVLAATLVLTIAGHYKEDSDDFNNTQSSLTNLGQMALVLRSQAQAGLAKFQNAVADLQRLLSSVPQHKEGLKQMQSLQGQQQRHKQVDKKLVKSMCKWVQTAATNDPVSSPTTTDNPPPGGDNQRGITASAPPAVDQTNTTLSTSSFPTSIGYTFVVYLILPVLLGYFLHKTLG